jgi:hypothetical protein
VMTQDQTEKTTDETPKQAETKQQQHEWLKWTPVAGILLSIFGILIASASLGLAFYFNSRTEAARDEMARIEFIKEMEALFPLWNLSVDSAKNGVFRAGSSDRFQSMTSFGEFDRQQGAADLVRKATLTRLFEPEANSQYDAIREATRDVIGCLSWVHNVRERHQTDNYTSPAYRELQEQVNVSTSRMYRAWGAFRETLKFELDNTTERRARYEFETLKESAKGRDCSLLVAPYYSEEHDNPYILPVTVDVKVNARDGEVPTEGKPYVYSWRAINATFCTVKEPFQSGSTTIGTSSMVFPGDSFWYPKQGTSITIRFECGNERYVASDFVVVRW